MISYFESGFSCKSKKFFQTFLSWPTETAAAPTAFSQLHPLASWWLLHIGVLGSILCSLLPTCFFVMPAGSRKMATISLCTQFSCFKNESSGPQYMPLTCLTSDTWDGKLLHPLKTFLHFHFPFTKFGSLFSNIFYILWFDIIDIS